MSTATGVKNTARQAAFNPTVEIITRLGFAVRGAIYIVMGVLAFRVAIGKGGQLTSPQGAIGAIGQQPAGRTFLWIVFFGLLSYALWRLICAIFDPLHKGNDVKGFFTRLGYFVSALSYTFLAWTAYGFIKGHAASSTSSQASFMGKFMATTTGRWLILGIGLVIIVVGIIGFIQGLRNTFERSFQVYALNADERRVAVGLARFGYAARGVVLAVVGALIAWAAYTSNPNQPVGMDAALSTLHKQTYGPGLLGVVALGLIAFGIYSLLGALWFRMRRSIN